MVGLSRRWNPVDVPDQSIPNRKAHGTTPRQLPQAPIEETIEKPPPPQKPAKSVFRPPEKVFAPPPLYSEKARKEGLQGTVSARLNIDKNGNVVAVEILEGLPLLAEQAVKAYNRWIFKPATLDGENVESHYFATVGFSLQ